MLDSCTILHGKPMTRLTTKQENFARIYIEVGKPGDAYRLAYDVESDGPWVDVEGSRLLRHPLVSLRIKEIREQLEEEALWKRVDSVRTLAEIAKGDDDDANPSDKIQAVRVLNQMMGWEKRVVDHRSSDGSMQAPTTIVIRAATAADLTDDQHDDDDRDDHAPA